MIYEKGTYDNFVGTTTHEKKTSKAPMKQENNSNSLIELLGDSHYQSDANISEAAALKKSSIPLLLRRST